MPAAKIKAMSAVPATPTLRRRPKQHQNQVGVENGTRNSERNAIGKITDSRSVTETGTAPGRAPGMAVETTPETEPGTAPAATPEMALSLPPGLINSARVRLDHQTKQQQNS